MSIPRQRIHARPLRRQHQVDADVARPLQQPLHEKAAACCGHPLCVWSADRARAGFRTDHIGCKTVSDRRHCGHVHDRRHSERSAKIHPIASSIFKEREGTRTRRRSGAIQAGGHRGASSGTVTERNHSDPQRPKSASADSKSGDGKPFGGSNPSLSAKSREVRFAGPLSLKGSGAASGGAEAFHAPP